MRTVEEVRERLDSALAWRSTLIERDRVFDRSGNFTKDFAKLNMEIEVLSWFLSKED